jgi:hypothetical protein
VNPLLRLLCLTVLAVPVFAGLSPFPAGIEILPGVAWGPVLHVLLVLGGVACVCGRAFLANVVAVTALVLSSVVYAGGLVSWLLAMVVGNSPGVAGSLHGAHYVGLALNMLSVIPLALAIVAAIPFDRLEQRLLRGTRGISSGEKYLLMFVRVFNHIVYVVIPNILEVMREEALLRAVSESASRSAGARSLGSLGRRLTAAMVQVGVSGICASLRFIPLWAREIDALPRRSSPKHRSRT